MGHEVSYLVVAELLHEMAVQFRRTARQKKATVIPTATRKVVEQYQRRGACTYGDLRQPGRFPDTKKKELVVGFSKRTVRAETAGSRAAKRCACTYLDS